MKSSAILVIGASGRTGRYVLNELVKRGYSNLSVLIRHEEYREIFEKLGTKVIVGDARSEVTMEKALTKKDIVINCMRSDNIIAPSELAVTKLVIKLLPKEKLYIVISAIGVADSIRNLSWQARLLFTTALRTVMTQKAAVEKVVKDSELKYVIVRPGGLLDEDGEENVTVVKPAPSGTFGTIHRTKVAIIMVDLMENPDSYNKIWECAEIS